MLRNLLLEALHPAYRHVRHTIGSHGARLAFRWTAPEHRFVIVTTGRAGSELLVSLLDSHPEIVCDSEILALRRAFPTAVVGVRSAVAGLRGAKAYGFKLLPHHAALQSDSDPPGYLRSFYEHGFRTIVLERRNWLQQAISAVRAYDTSYHYRTGDRVDFSPRLVDPMAVLAALFMIEETVTHTHAALAEIPQLRLFYEDDLAEPGQQQRTADKVCAYLGLATARVESDLIKAAPGSLVEQVANFDEIAAVLSATRYAGYLEDAEAHTDSQ